MFFNNQSQDILSNVIYSDATNIKTPTRVLRGDLSVPCKSASGSAGGASIVAQYLETVWFKKAKSNAVGVIKQATIDSLYSAALALDKTFDEYHDEYPTLYSLLTEANKLQKFNSNGITFVKTIDGLKQYIHKYGCVLLETYLTSTMLTTSMNNGYLISDAGTIKNRDFTKGFVAYGYDTTGVFVQNNLGEGWGQRGFAKIAWSVLTSTLSLPDSDEKACVFVKAGVLKNCLN